VDLVILSQALHHAEDPASLGQRAPSFAFARPGDDSRPAQAQVDKAQQLYGDRWPGFAESDLQRWLEAAGFKKIEISVVAREESPPHFQTILAGAEK